MTKLTLRLATLLTLLSCSSERESPVDATELGPRFMTAVSEEVIVDSELTLDENLDKALGIVRAVCEGGFYSVSCASSSIFPSMDIDPDNLLDVELTVNQAAHIEPNYVFIRCDSDASPPPKTLVQECQQLVEKQVLIGQ